MVNVPVCQNNVRLLFVRYWKK